MAIRLVHVVEAHTPEDAVRLCSLLLRKLPASEIEQSVIVMGGRPAGLVVPDDVASRQIGEPLYFGRVLASGRLGRAVAEQRPDALFAYSAVAAAAAGSCDGGVPVAAILADPGDAAESSRWILSGHGGPVDVICLSGTVQRRLIERGVSMVATAVIRPGVDFAEIRQARQSVDRSQLGLPETGGQAGEATHPRVLVTPSPPSRVGGQYHAVWAMAILHHIWPDAVMIVPGRSREQRRIARLVETIYCPRAFRLVEDRYSPAELMAVADALVVPALGDVPTGWLAWAMAAGVPMIGSAVPCIAEFVADRQNGFLCRPGEPHTLAVRVRTAFESPEVVRQCSQTARQQSYETFRSERCVEEFLKVIRNIAARQPALTAVHDAAVRT
jgi:hypothetical protein